MTQESQPVSVPDASLKPTIPSGTAWSPPPIDQKKAAYLMVSMGTMKSIQYDLKHFPKAPPARVFSDYVEDKDSSFSEGCEDRGISSTLFWSGEAGLNTPVKLYSNSSKGVKGIGYVMDVSKLEVPYADFEGSNTSRKYHPTLEVKKSESTNHSSNEPECYGKDTQNASKFADKTGVYKQLSRGARVYNTNQARWSRGAQTYATEGSADIFAEAVHRRYHNPKHGYSETNTCMPLNEAVVWQKQQEQNPIKGILIRTDSVSKEELSEALTLIKENSKLNLYVYNIEAKDHIAKFCNNNNAIDLLDHLIQIQKTQASSGASSIKESLNRYQPMLHPITKTVPEPILFDFLSKESNNQEKQPTAPATATPAVEPKAELPATPPAELKATEPETAEPPAEPKAQPPAQPEAEPEAQPEAQPPAQPKPVTSLAESPHSFFSSGSVCTKLTKGAKWFSGVAAFGFVSLTAFEAATALWKPDLQVSGYLSQLNSSLLIAIFVVAALAALSTAIAAGVMAFRKSPEESNNKYALLLEA